MATTIDAMVAAGKAAGIEISATQAAFAAGFSQARNGTSLSGKKIKLLCEFSCLDTSPCSTLSWPTR